MHGLKSLFKDFTMRMIEVKTQSQECNLKARPLNILPSEMKFTRLYLNTSSEKTTATKQREGEESDAIISGKITKY